MGRGVLELSETLATAKRRAAVAMAMWRLLALSCLPPPVAAVAALTPSRLGASTSMRLANLLPKRMGIMLMVAKPRAPPLAVPIAARTMF